jgi:hypothetical protein
MKLRPQAETLSGSPQPNFVAFQPAAIIAKRAPTGSDTGYAFGQIWDDKVGGVAYILVNVIAGIATWQIATAVAGTVATLTGDTGTANPSAGNIQIAGTANHIVTSASGSTVTLDLTGPYAPTTFTSHGVLIGETTSSIVATAAGTNGQVLIGNTGGDPSFQAPGALSGLTAHGVVLGEGASAFAATVAGSTGQVLIGATGADPAFGAIGVNSALTGIVLGNTNSAFTTTTFTAAASFVPAFSLGTPGDSAWTYSAQLGRYTRMGAIVYFHARIVWSNFTNTTGSGNWQLNIPVASGAFTSTGQIMVSGSGVDASAETANLPANFTGVIGSGASIVALAVEEGGVGNAANALFTLTVSQVKTAGTMNVSGWYFAA